MSSAQEEDTDEVLVVADVQGVGRPELGQAELLEEFVIDHLDESCHCRQLRELDVDEFTIAKNVDASRLHQRTQVHTREIRVVADEDVQTLGTRKTRRVDTRQRAFPKKVREL
eukprot:CAMPEP_0205947870 /NCGR_PEP_ID=MMETSP1459-20131121/268_1 /ASSEMBLY_ACC=CAM_ASM_001120 /TAXON_ID=41880 /ORGANISM="Pycnococcus provasolii, Strain RCC931" /LENGTH=112 /DNA_ID=CAMNT_0053319017 /DNA_START=64 /DNA_END=399 /DNA_ORIENTATION=+